MVDVKDNSGKIVAKVGSKEEALWTRVMKSCEAAIEASENEIAIQTELLQIAKLKVVIEQKKFKRNPKNTPVGVG